jgi:hypothetical protein
MDNSHPGNDTDSRETSAKQATISRFLSRLNQPFVVTVIGGAMVFLVTSSIQQRYWTAQQKYLFQQESIRFKLAAVDETIKSVDQLVSAYSAEFTSYDSHFDKGQQRKIDDELEAADKHWDQEFVLRKVRVNVYFPGPEIQKALGQVNEDLGTLDCYMMRLGTKDVPPGFGCEELRLNDLSQKDLIAQGRQVIDATQEALQKLARLMIDSIGKA